MTKTAIPAPGLAPPVGPYSYALRSGALLFISGQVGLDPATGHLAPGGAPAEAAQAFANLAAVLQAAGRRFDDVLRMGVFLTDMADFAAVNEACRHRFAEPYPARTTVAVAALPLGASVEIDLIVRA